MKILIDKLLEDNRYSAEFKVELTDQEQAQVDAFGDPLVNFGGSFTGPPAFTLADEFRALVAGLPYTQSMDGNGDVDAKDKMNVWITEVKTRLTSAKNTLVGLTDDFTGEVVETV